MVFELCSVWTVPKSLPRFDWLNHQNRLTVLTNLLSANFSLYGDQVLLSDWFDIQNSQMSLTLLDRRLRSEWILVSEVVVGFGITNKWDIRPAFYLDFPINYDGGNDSYAISVSLGRIL